MTKSFTRFVYSLAFLNLAVFAHGAQADASVVRQQPVVQEQYDGGFKDMYPQALAWIHTYLKATEQDVADQMEFPHYSDGFKHPVTVRFVDGIPTPRENPYFYVQPGSSANGFSQELLVNVEEFAHGGPERRGIYYAMTQLILNDLVAGKPVAALPAWVQEGLGVYFSGDGDFFVKETAEQYRRSEVADLILDLNSTYPYLTNKQWANYFLAIQYIVQKGGPVSLHLFVRDMVNGKPAANAIFDALRQHWEDFESGYTAYARETFSNLARPDDQPVQGEGASH